MGAGLISAGVGGGLGLLGGLIDMFAGEEGDFQIPAEIQAVMGPLANVLREGLADLPDVPIEEFNAAIDEFLAGDLPELPSAGFEPEVQEQIREATLGGLQPTFEEARRNVKDLLGDVGIGTITGQALAGTEADIGQITASTLADLEKFFQTTGFEQGLDLAEAETQQQLLPVNIRGQQLGALQGIRQQNIANALGFTGGAPTLPPQPSGISNLFQGLAGTASQVGGAIQNQQLIDALTQRK